MAPNRRCFIHVGLPKTGTSFLQNTFWGSREALGQQGLRMLPKRRADHYRVTLAIRELLDEELDHPAAFTALARLARQAGQVEGNVLLSQEALAPSTEDQVAHLLEILQDFEVHVVVTARDLARQLPSAWQQRMQSRLTYSYDEFLDAVQQRTEAAEDLWANQDLVDVLRRWSAHVPPERVHVVTVPAVDDGSATLLGRFCQVLGVDPATLTSDEVGSGGSLGLVQAELMRRVNLALGDRLPSDRAGYARVGRAYLAAQVLRPQSGERIRMPAERRDWCDGVARSWVEHLREGGYDVVGDVADLLPTDAAYTDAAQDVAAEDLVDSAAHALATILELRAQELAEQSAERTEALGAEASGTEASSGPSPQPSTTSRDRRGLLGRLRRR